MKKSDRKRKLVWTSIIKKGRRENIRNIKNRNTRVKFNTCLDKDKKERTWKLELHD